MFSSSNSHNPFQFMMTNQTMMPGNPSSTPGDQASSPFFHFPAPFFDDCDADGLLISQIFSQQPILASSGNGEPSVPAMEVKKVAARKKRSSDGSGGIQVTIPRKRTGKKDRHSKIYTSQGPRDRRMRLSLQIARKFFDLQDMLGFDKASKTIEWLFSKSKAAIKEVTENFPRVKESCSGGGKTTVSSTSESEVVSVAEETEDNGEQKGKEKKDKKSRKASTNVPVPRESRQKARARARERTIEKMKKKSDESNLQSSSPHESGENLGASSQTNSSWKAVIQKEDEQYHRAPMVPMPELQMDSVSIIEKFLGVNTITPRSSSMGNYSHDIANLSIRGNSDESYSVFSESWRMNTDKKQYTYCGMTNVKEAGSSGNVIQVQNPSSIFMANLNTQEQNPSSVLMIPSRELNPNSVFMTPSSVREGNPTSVLVSTPNSGLHSHFQENQLCSNHVVANKYCNFY